MRTTMLTILPVLAFLSLPNPSPGGWGGRSCGPVGPSAIATPIWNTPAALPPACADGWHSETTGDTGVPCWVYWQDGRMTRAYIPKVDGYRVVIDGRWQAADVPDDLPAFVRPAVVKKCKCSKCCECKEPCPCKAGGKACCSECKCKPADTMLRAIEAEQEEPLPTGVDSSKLRHDGQERFIIDGKQVSRQQYMQLIQGGQIPDDAGKLRLTIIGVEAERTAVLKDLGSATPLSSWAGKLVVQDYAPDAWAVANAGFVTTGKPTIYLQQPDGKVLLRVDQYDGPVALADAIRKADPNYSPDKDPNGKPKPKPDDAPALPVSPNVLWGAGGALAAFLLFRKR